MGKLRYSSRHLISESTWLHSVSQVPASQWGHVTELWAVKRECALFPSLSLIGAVGNEAVGRWKQLGFLSHLVEQLQAVETLGPHQTLRSMGKKPLMRCAFEIAGLIDHSVRPRPLIQSWYVRIGHADGPNSRGVKGPTIPVSRGKHHS